MSTEAQRHPSALGIKSGKGFTMSTTVSRLRWGCKNNHSKNSNNSKGAGTANFLPRHRSRWDGGGGGG